MDTYIYLLLAFFLSIFWIIIYYYKVDLRKKMIKTGIIGGFLGFIAEYWYLKDYWRPPTILGNAVISVEDFLVGFFLFGISISIYNFVFKKQDSKDKSDKSRKTHFFVFFIIGILAMIILPSYGYNSMFVSPALFLLFTIIIVIIRKDLFYKALYSGILLVTIVAPIYILLFVIISPNYWQNYWLLSNTKYDITLFGKIPCIEIIWYFSWGSFCGVCYSFYSGTKPISYKAL
jgi:hypothetical protein